MQHQRRVTWSMRYVGAAAVFAVLGCGTGGDDSASGEPAAAGDTGAALMSESVAGDTVLAAGVRARKTPPMPKHFDDMTGREFARYVRQLRFAAAAGWERQRRCEGGSATNCRIFIKPEIGADSVGPADTSSFVIAALTNRGTETENRYKIPGGTTAYWLVEQDSKARRTRMIVIASDSTASALPGTHPYEACEGHTPGQLKADMQGCGSRALTPADTLNLQVDLEAWISCLVGCCTA